MIAVILAAGCGSRLMPKTSDRPKALVQFLGRPLIQRQLDVMASLNIRDIRFIGGHCIETLQRIAPGKIYTNFDFATTNMVYSLSLARDAFDGKSDILVSYSDIVYEARVLKSLLMAKCNEAATIVDSNWKQYWTSRHGNPMFDSESLKLDADKNLTEIGGKPESLNDIQGQYIGLTKISRNFSSRFFDVFYRKQLPNSISMTEYFQELIAEGHKISAVLSRAGWLEFDSISDYDTYCDWNQKGILDMFYKDSCTRSSLKGDSASFLEIS